ncbi:FG-GAP repeat domain-containing protein [Streptomyces sp. NPDC059063]|uniref:FG-GAP repeat domain-containing protein n=1 Tax=unclassified Streptomyces TaxID=2593676 RepID=UPI00369C73E8
MIKQSKIKQSNVPSRALVGSAFIPVLALAVVAPDAQALPAAKAPAAAQAAPAGHGPWTAPKELPGVTDVVDLKANRDGTVAGLFDRGDERVLAVRPAGSATWGPAKPVSGAWLQRTDDGAVSLLSSTQLGSGQLNTLSLARLAPDGTAFGPAEEVAKGEAFHRPTLAADASGHQVLAWMDKDRKLTVRERLSPDVGWSRLVTLDQLPEPIVRDDHTYDYRLYDLRVAVAEDGTVGVLWGGNSDYQGDGVDPDPTAYKWHYKYLEKAAGADSWTAPRDLPLLGDKPKNVSFAAHPKGGFHLLSDGVYAWKPAGVAQWGPTQKTGIGAGKSAPAELLTAPNGDVTAVGWQTGGRIAVARRPAADGAWGPARELARSAADGSLSAAQSPAGEVVVGYAQNRYELGQKSRVDFVTTTVAANGIARPGTLNAPTKGTASYGRIALDGRGRPTTAWTQVSDDWRTRTSFTATAAERALPKWHDYSHDTRGDLVGISTTGALNLFTQDGAQRPFQLRDWPVKTRVVPFGDFDGDRVNDLILRLPDGETRLYTPVLGGMPTPESPYRKLARDWSKYDTILASGDQTGNGRPDFLARDKATGDVYLYAYKDKDGFAPRVKIRSGMTGYKRLIGAGDLNGDGIGDVLALDGSGSLWRFNGTRTGRLGDRVRVFKDWGASYKDVIGAGDVDGDGKHDLVSRDTSNRLWLNPGSGTGTFAGRKQFGEAPYWKQWAAIG